MAVTINKDTKIYGSFSLTPGNNGTIFFNDAFKKHGVNAIYKSFYSDDIIKTIESVKHLEFGGFAVSMPHKIDICRFLNERHDSVVRIGACNTVVIKDGKLHGYNTDYLGVLDYFNEISLKGNISIIGNGGFSQAIQYACQILNIKYMVFKRDEIQFINELKESVVFNATPVDINVKNKMLIDGRPFTKEGQKIALYQAKHQFELYTGLKYYG